MISSVLQQPTRLHDTSVQSHQDIMKCDGIGPYAPIFRRNSRDSGGCQIFYLLSINLLTRPRTIELARLLKPANQLPSSPSNRSCHRSFPATISCSHEICESPHWLSFSSSQWCSGSGGRLRLWALNLCPFRKVLAMLTRFWPPWSLETYRHLFDWRV